MFKEKLSELNFISIIIFIAFMIAIVLMLSEWLSGTKDGFYEEMTEDIIEHHTGINLDLSPGYYD